jgi:hypothetical protein
MAAPGFNTAHGFDNGPTPPGFGFGRQYQGYYPPMPTYYPPQAPYMALPPPMMSMAPQFPMGQVYAGGAPVPDHGFPGLILRNETGGCGYPGYYYLYPQEHCKIHVFKTKEKPWQKTVNSYDNSNHIKVVVPVSTTIKELMQNLGCANDDAKMNIMYECTEKGNGSWAHGIKLGGDDKDKMKKSIGEYGWNKTRTGFPGQRPVVWLWLTDKGL